ncbi:hypothetical protein [Actinoplanes sp. NPDC049681]|uniref:hypothetical protein n=1 Tax=Actinoplanes sp. NPDC049681 TaxID=3363905 RepID=UPI0037B0B092
MVKGSRACSWAAVIALLVVLAPLPAAAAATYSVKLSISASAKLSNRFLYVWNRSTWQYHVVQGDGDSTTGSVSLPPGDYLAVARYGYYRQRNYLLVRTFKVSTAGLTVTLDERAAKETGITADDTTAKRANAAAWLTVPGGDTVGFTGGGPAKNYVTPFSVTGVSLRLHELLAESGASTAVPSPYRYDLYKVFTTTVPSTPVVKVTTAQLAKTVTSLRAQGVTTLGALGSAVKGGWSGSYLESPVRLPGAVTEYVTPGLALHRRLTYGSAESYLTLPDRTLSAGTTAGTTVGAGPFAPGHGASARAGDTVRVDEPAAWGDAAGNPGYDARSSERHEASLDGDVVRLDQTLTRKVAWSQLSTTVRSEWTATAPGDGPLPLIDARLTVSGLDATNRAATTVQLSAAAQTRGGAAASVTRIEYSTDDGHTWTTLDGAGLTVPPSAAFVSLRLTAGNEQGGSLRRTVIRAFAGPASPPDETAGATKITNVVVNGGKDLAFGTSGSTSFTTTFTATDPSGIADGDAYLYHGSYQAPDGLILAAGPADCVKSSDATSVCTARFTMDVRVDAAKNALSGAWKVAAWAHAADGTGFTDRHAAGAVGLKRTTKLTADATPEPVKKGKTITITGTLTRAGWETWTYQGYAGRTITLQYLKANTTTWKTVKTAKTDPNGKLKTTVTASADGSYRWTWAGDTTSTAATSGADYIDVR